MGNDRPAQVIPVLLLCLLISGGFAATHLFAPPSASTVMHAFRNALHAPGFAALAVTLFLLLRSRMESGMALAGATSLCVGTAIIGELLQIATAGDASVVDLANDAAGDAGALLLMSFFDNDVLPALKRKSRFVLLAGGLLIMATAFHPAVSISHALVARAAALPELISFDHGWERVLYRSYGGAEITRIPLGDDGGLVAVVSMGRAQYSGLVIEPYPDWRGYTALRFSILALGHTPRRVTLRIDDVAHNGQYTDRFNRVFEINSSVSEFVVPLNEIAALQNGRKLRLDAVRSMMFFMIDTDGSEKIIIDDIRLLSD